MSDADSQDAYKPAQIAALIETAGVAKAALPLHRMATLALLAGAFIGFGAAFWCIAMAGADPGFGPARVLGGTVFALGLILVVVGGAELFTGNNLIVMAWAGRKVSTALLLKNWGIVYAGNFVGAVMTAVIMFLTTQYTFSGGAIGLQALSIANHKAGLAFIPALALGIMCNALVCLAVWMTYSARSTTDKILAIIFPIAAFIAAGFEHSVANMYYIPLALLMQAFAPASFWESIHKTPADFPNLTLYNFFIGNLLPVTIGNIIGGAVMVGVVYWFVYLRKRPTK